MKEVNIETEGVAPQELPAAVVATMTGDLLAAQAAQGNSISIIHRVYEGERCVASVIVMGTAAIQNWIVHGFIEVGKHDREKAREAVLAAACRAAATICDSGGERIPKPGLS